MNTIVRPALGEEHQLGALYDARKDCFLPTTAFTSGIPADAYETQWEESKKIALCNSAENKAKFETLGLPAPLAASCLAGWPTLRGSGEFLSPSDPLKADEVYYALNFSRSTITQELSLEHEGVLEAVENAVLGRGLAATHVVTRVLWGASCTVTATGHVPDPSERQDIAARFQEAVRKLEKFKKNELELRMVHRIAADVLHPSLSLQTYSDLIPESSQPLTTLPEIEEHLEKIFDLAEEGYAEAQPLSYVLSPVQSFLGHGSAAQPGFETVPQLSTAHFERALGLYDSFGVSRHMLEDYYKRLKKHRTAVRADHREDVRDALEEVTAAETRFKTKFANLLTAVRGGRKQGRVFEAFLEEFSTGESSPTQLLSIMDQSSSKMDLIETIRTGGGTCLDANAVDEQAFANHFVLYFSENAMKHSSWQPNLDLIKQLLRDKPADIVAVDCDAGGASLEKPRVAKFKNGRCKIGDVIDQRDQEAALSFVRLDPGSIDVSMKDPPSQRKPMKIPCPGRPTCASDDRDWVCAKCRVKVEFGVVDSFLYCECGRAPLSGVSFNCQQGHGDQYTRYPPQYLHKLLQGLPTPPETNLLILGETGVGKSTFINSFINYLSFDKLDDALAARYLNWIIPCSFATQREDPDGRLIQTEVRIGQDEDERDGSKGDSATQQATVYPVYYGGGLIRLIDTPGIGDTRGPDQDYQNMINILRVLRNYEKLHGILILLKPNNARLTVMFRFCVKELLTQLHRNAAENMVFGFTNTRGSNYQPGDTFQPLEQLLKEYKDVIPGLFKETVYCFDSESFRYLAARHKGIDMGHIDDYRRSWDHSAHEARRMVSYFQNKKPHEVRNTVSLNETRYLITQLIQPMAQIMTAIADTVKQSDDKIKDLQDTRTTGAKLKEKLTMTKTVIDSKQLDMPRTVCANSECCSLISQDNNPFNQVALFKSRCHDPCYLKDVPVEQIGAKEIPPCAAFRGHENCQVCGHHWKEHQHVLVEYTERTETTTDPNVQNALNQNQDEASAKQIQIAALKQLIQELQEEHRMIQESQARFSHYLQENSITHYNDATIEYFEHLIKDERSKVSRGLPRTRLDQMEKDKASYENFINAMKMGKKSAGYRTLDENGVYDLVKRLYAMKHYGKNLKDCAKKTGQAYSATFRERPYRVRNQAQGKSTGFFDYLGSFIPGVSSNRHSTQVASVRTSQVVKPTRPIPTSPKPQTQSSSRPGPAKLVKNHAYNVMNSRAFPQMSQTTHQAPPSNPTPGAWDDSDDEFKPNEPSKSIQVPEWNNIRNQDWQGSSSKAALYESDDSDDAGVSRRETEFKPPEMITQRSAGQGGIHNHFFEDDPVNAAKTTSPSMPSLTSQQSTRDSSASALSRWDSTQSPNSARSSSYPASDFTSPSYGSPNFSSSASPWSANSPPAQFAPPNYPPKNYSPPGHPPMGYSSSTYPPFGHPERPGYPNPDGVLGHGVVPVMIQPDHPNAPHGPGDLKNNKGRWLSNVKNKLKGKN